MDRNTLISTILVALIASIPSTIVALRTSAKVEAVADKVEVVHKATNSLKDELVAVTRSDALQEGHTAGVKDEKSAQKKAKK